MFCVKKYLLGSEFKLRVARGGWGERGDSAKSKREQWMDNLENNWRLYMYMFICTYKSFCENSARKISRAVNNLGKLS